MGGKREVMSKEEEEEEEEGMEQWVPLFEIFLNSPFPETEASLWFQQHAPPPTSAFLSFLLQTQTQPIIFLQTLPPFVQSEYSPSSPTTPHASPAPSSAPSPPAYSTPTALPPTSGSAVPPPTCSTKCRSRTANTTSTQFQNGFPVLLLLLASYLGSLSVPNSLRPLNLPPRAQM
ncbi:uncharacterized protein M6B38_125355 [Iris pallida]|uniref:Uncharacterized protein n=1 Tax=Iris pallida TaxID=29817 RepID=A0AAX6GW59_IRIPA|nr:uncharacterized protein M6B38_125355 [Iris pallida]